MPSITPRSSESWSECGRVYVGNTELFGQLLPLRPDVQELFCPGTILHPQRS